MGISEDKVPLLQLTPLRPGYNTDDLLFSGHFSLALSVPEPSLTEWHLSS